ncbi:MAG: hypothetical protein ACYTAN_03300 [Planctomycetota bacterium]|jgi:hypothetical protein
MLSITAACFDQLDELRASLHDRWFDFDSMCFDQETGCLQIPFDGDAAGPKGPFENTLSIYGVRDVKYKDTEKIGIYCFNKMKVDVKSCEIVLDADILRIDVRISPEFSIMFD